MRELVLLLAAAGLASAETAKIADLNFLAGAWRGALGDTTIEEHWMSADGDALIGMYRETNKGKTGTTEMCAIWSREAGPVLLLRHFAPGLIAREEKDKPLEFGLISIAGKRAVFQMAETKTRLTYERTSERELMVTLEKEGRQPLRFVYNQMAAGQ